MNGRNPGTGYAAMDNSRLARIADDRSRPSARTGRLERLRTAVVFGAVANRVNFCTMGA
jgi:hypothetical protein